MCRRTWAASWAIFCLAACWARPAWSGRILVCRWISAILPFSSANLGYALAGLEFQLGAAQVAWRSFGVLAIGAVNLAVFARPLRTALRA